MSVAFVCIQNAGRSQIARTFAMEEKERRDVDVEIKTGGTDPADHIHPEVEKLLNTQGFDLEDRTPKEITPEDLQDCDYVITMGCGADEVCPATWNGKSRDWDLKDPDGQDVETVRRIGDEIKSRVRDLFDEILEAN